MKRKHTNASSDYLGTINASQTGFWSAVVVAVFNVASSILMIVSWTTTPFSKWSGIERFAESFSTFQMLSMLPGLVVVIAFIPMMAAIHYLAPRQKQIFSSIGLIFGCIGTTLLGFQYYSQLTSIRQSLLSGALDGLDLFVVGNANSVWWPIETLGYGFMGLATLFAAFVFSSQGCGGWIKRLFVANGVLSVAGLFAYPFSLGTSAILLGLLVWVVIFPISVTLIAIDMLKRQ